MVEIRAAQLRFDVAETDRYADAHRYVEQGHQKRKVAITVDPTT